MRAQRSAMVLAAFLVSAYAGAGTHFATTADRHTIRPRQKTRGGVQLHF